MTTDFTSNAQLLISKSALLSNIRLYRNTIGKTKMLVMVKANGYGTDSLLVAKTIEKEVDYLGVAFPATGMYLRQHGISTPIFVMACMPSDLEKMVVGNLEPVLYSIEVIKAAIDLNQPLNVHLEIDAGMKRLGLAKEDLNQIIALINNSRLTVVSVFAHAVAPGETAHDEFTHQQVSYFSACFNQLYVGLKTKPLKQFMPTAGVTRFAQYQFDMVRLGIGVYGYDPSSQLLNQLKPVATLQCYILQILEVKQGETIGYSRNGTLATPGKIATLSIGYGDGYLRANGNGHSTVFINGKIAKTVGHICMDLMMVDVTNIECKPGDTVELFGSHLGMADLAASTGTIPYEILTNINSRVQRVLVD